jgi:hypothetical protein
MFKGDGSLQAAGFKKSGVFPVQLMIRELLSCAFCRKKLLH